VLNTLLSNYVLEGDIDLTGHTHLFDEFGSGDEEEIPDIFQPEKLIQSLEISSVSDL